MYLGEKTHFSYDCPVKKIDKSFTYGLDIHASYTQSTGIDKKCLVHVFKIRPRKIRVQQKFTEFAQNELKCAESRTPPNLP